MRLLDEIRAYTRPLYQQVVRSGHLFQPHLDHAAQRWHFAEHLLRPLLPRRFGMRIGQAFASHEACSAPNSLLIYDEWYCIPLADSLIPCEYVYAICEAQPKLDAAQFSQALERVAALKKLPRARATAHDITPTQHLAVFGARYAQLPNDTLNPYLGYIFAQTADDPRALHRVMREMFEQRELLPEHSPDAIICLSAGWVITRQTFSGNVSVPRSSFSRFGLLQLGEDVLTWVYLLLNVSLSQIHLRGPDLLRLLEDVVAEARRH